MAQPMAPPMPPSGYGPGPAAPYQPMAVSAPAPMTMEMATPCLQHIDQLCAVPGVVVKEKTQVVDAIMQSIGGAYEEANKYMVYELPPDRKLAIDHGEPGTWLPSGPEIDSLKPLLFVQEESSCCLRATLAYFGGLNLRALKLHMYGGGYEQITVDRPCRLGACCCCPLEMTVYQGQQMIGKVEEDCSCWDDCCLCICTQRVMVGNSRQSLVHKYSLRNYGCCCGRVDNCCGATCCKPQFFIDVVEPDGQLAAVIQKTYGSGGCDDCCRCAFDFNNYVIPFPQKANGVERALMLTALLSVEYAYHSRTGGEGNNNNN